MKDSKMGLSFKKLFQKKQLPTYWQSYVASLKDAHQKSISETKFVIFDCETSGLNAKKDRILSMGCMTLIGHKMKVQEVFERYLNQEVFNRESVPIHGLLKKGQLQNKIEEEKAIEEFLAYIHGAVLVGHHIGFDVACVNFALKRMGLPKLKNKVLDTGILYKRTKHEIYETLANKHFTLDEVCDELKVLKKDRHTALGDAYLTAIVFLRILGRLNKDGQMKMKELLYVPKMIY